MQPNTATKSEPAHLPDMPTTGAAAEPSTAAQRARVEVGRAIDCEHPAAPPDVRSDLVEAALEHPMAVVVMVITRDRITQHAHLHLGGLHTAMRDFHRTGPGSWWKSRDPDFVSHDEHIGIELAEFVDALDLPDRVADMLPRAPSNPNSEARLLAAAAAATLQEPGASHAR